MQPDTKPLPNDHKPLRVGVVGVSGAWSSETLAKRLAEATGGPRLLIEMDRVRLDLATGQAWFAGVDLSELDGLVVKKVGQSYSPLLLDRLDVLRYLSGRGLPVLSDPARIQGLIDRLSCTTTLALANIPMPATTITEDVDLALETIAAYGEAVLKPLYSTKARGMLVLRPVEGLRELLEHYRRENPVLYLQKTVDLGERDLGIVFLGGEYLTTYARNRKPGAWNTTTASGGKYSAFDPEPEVIELARRAQEPFGLDFTCVDVALTPDGPVVFEVSAFGGFRGLLEARGLDAASLLADYAVAAIRGRKRA